LGGPAGPHFTFLNYSVIRFDSPVPSYFEGSRFGPAGSPKAALRWVGKRRSCVCIN